MEHFTEDLACLVFTQVTNVRDRRALAAVNATFRRASRRVESLPVALDHNVPVTGTGNGPVLRGDFEDLIAHVFDHAGAFDLPRELFMELVRLTVADTATLPLIIYEGTTPRTDKDNFDNFCIHAAKAGRLDVLRWARENSDWGEWDSLVWQSAAIKGHLDILQWGEEIWPSSCSCPCAAAACGGQIETLKWLLQDRTCPCEDPEWRCASAARNGQLEALRWLREVHGDPWDENVFIQTLENQPEHGYGDNAKKNISDVLQYAFDNQCPGWTRYGGRWAFEPLRFIKNIE